MYGILYSSDITDRKTCIVFIKFIPVLSQYLGGIVPMPGCFLAHPITESIEELNKVRVSLNEEPN